MSVLAGRFLLHFDDVNRVPGTLDFTGVVATLQKEFVDSTYDETFLMKWACLRYRRELRHFRESTKSLNGHEKGRVRW